MKALNRIAEIIVPKLPFFHSDKLMKWKSKSPKKTIKWKNPSLAEEFPELK